MPTADAGFATSEPAAAKRTAVRREIERRVLWLATAIVHHANRVRPHRSGLKVGGHQASSASLVPIVTALWFEWLRAGDRSRSSRTPRRCCMRSTTCPQNQNHSSQLSTVQFAEELHPVP